MTSLRRALIVFAAAGVLGLGGLLAQPAPSAKANVACDVTAPLGVAGDVLGGVTGGIGGGNPVGDACNAVSGGVMGGLTSPLDGALEGISNGILGQVTSWVSDGAVWLIEKVAGQIETSTTPKLTTKGFLTEYRKMAEIAALLAAAMLLLAGLEAVAQGSWGVLGRAVFVSVPVAFLGTSVAFAVVQLALVATDGLSHAISSATHEHSRHFFKSALGGLSHAGGDAGEALNPAAPPAGRVTGGTAAPLFVTFLAAIVGAFAAFFIWLEMLMRDAAVYVVALFMPLSLAAAIWPRWRGALRRTAELEVVVIGSKFVIVSILALAAGLAAENDGGIEPLLAATALMLVACFAPIMLLKLVPFAEGAMTAAYGRRSAAGGAVRLGYEANMIRNLARSNWGGRSSSPPEVWNVATERSNAAEGKGGAKGAASGSGTKSAGGESAGTAAGSSAGSAAGAGAAAGAAPVAGSIAAAKGSKAAGERLANSGVGQAGASGGGGGEAAPPAQTSDPGAPRPAEQPSSSEEHGAAQAPRPPQELPAKEGKEEKP